MPELGSAQSSGGSSNIRVDKSGTPLVYESINKGGEYVIKGGDFSEKSFTYNAGVNQGERSGTRNQSNRFDLTGFYRVELRCRGHQDSFAGFEIYYSFSIGGNQFSGGTRNAGGNPSNSDVAIGVTATTISANEQVTINCAIHNTTLSIGATAYLSGSYVYQSGTTTFQHSIGTSVEVGWINNSFGTPGNGDFSTTAYLAGNTLDKSTSALGYGLTSNSSLSRKVSWSNVTERTEMNTGFTLHKGKMFSY
jgi:hypothetical protein